MRTVPLLFLLAILPGVAKAQLNPTPAQDKRSEDVVNRGEHVMGFSHEATTHHFRLFKDGGEIAVTAKDPNDKASIDQIRAHLGHIAKMFSAGNFKAPMLIHDTNPPGAATMTRLKEQIRYEFSETERGARIRLVTAGPETTDAVHAFLLFQIVDHQTRDAPTIGDELSKKLLRRAAIVAAFPPQSFDAFFRDDGNHDKARHGIGPPQVEGRVQKKTGQQYGRKISAELSLLRVRVHRCTAKGASHSSFRTREEWHHDKGNARQNDAGNAVLGSSHGPQVRRGFVRDVGGETQETYADNLQGSPLVPFAAVHIGISRHPPQQNRTGRHFDKAVDTKSDKRHTPGDSAGDNGHQAFQGIPADGEVFEPSPMAHDSRTFQDTDFSHPCSLSPLVPNQSKGNLGATRVQ